MLDWPSDDHLVDNSDDDELGEQSMSIILPTLCAWCVLQGRGAMTEDTFRCDQATQSVKQNQHCIGKLIADHPDWIVHLLTEEITFLVAHGGDPQHTDALTGRSPLHECAVHGSIVGMKALMEMDMKNLSGDNMLDSMLEEASVAQHYDRGNEAKELDHARREKNEQSLDLMATTNLGLTIFHLAAMKGHSILLERMVNHMSKDFELEHTVSWTKQHNEDGETYYYNETTGETSWDVAVFHKESVSVVVNAFDAPDHLGFTPTMYAAEKGHVACLKVLFQALCSTKNRRQSSSFELQVARPHSRTLSHYAAMNGRVNVLLYLFSVNACHHFHQDIECRSPIDIAKTFNRLGCVAFLTATCPHPFLHHSSSCCGVCATFVSVKNGPVYCPIPGHRNLTICDSVMDTLSQRTNKSNYDTGYELWVKRSDVGVNYKDAVRTEAIEIEELKEAACSVIRCLGLEKEKLKVALSDCVESCALFCKTHDDLDSISCPTFHTIVSHLPVVQHLSGLHRSYICRESSVKSAVVA